jgi:putative addiction module killer protein
VIFERVRGFKSGFAAWLTGIPGDAKPVGEGVSELRVDIGPGYRVHYVQRKGVFILLLCGGNKSAQQNDIARALCMAREMED